MKKNQAKEEVNPKTAKRNDENRIRTMKALRMMPLERTFKILVSQSMDP